MPAGSSMDHEMASGVPTGFVHDFACRAQVKGCRSVVKKASVPTRREAGVVLRLRKVRRHRPLGHACCDRLHNGALRRMRASCRNLFLRLSKVMRWMTVFMSFDLI